MGTRLVGMVQWQADLATLPERARDQFPRVLGKAGLNIKNDWKASWKAASARHGHIPHLIRWVGYDVNDRGKDRWELDVGVRGGMPQSRLASFISFGTLTSGPHDAGQSSLDAEVPVAVRFIAELAEKLLGTHE